MTRKIFRHLVIVNTIRGKFKVFKIDEKKYYSNEFKGNYEIVLLTGTINTMNDEFYTHIHMSAGIDNIFLYL